ncbi:MAG: PEGA domain-containing protein [Deltaproteobacteria bacterium]|nr:PEGA domain-containing protein [Deltaproteobacteria bacterium]MBI3293096.1 PEGA domain-containing protein [Deltaproteobacteria bacterium]
MNRIFLCLSTLIALGCTHSREIKISSESPGAHVEINGNYVGRTPFVTKIESQNGINVVGTPQSDGLCKQESYYSEATELPPHILLNMKLCDRKPAAQGPPTSPPINNFNIQNNNDAHATISK